MIFYCIIYPFVYLDIRSYNGPRKDEVIQASSEFVLTWLHFKKKYKQGTHTWPPAPLQKTYEVFEKYLVDYPDQHFKQQFLQKVKHGWRTGFVGSRKNLTKRSKNFVDTVDQYLTVVNKFTSELRNGIVFPLHDSITLEYVFSIFTVPKKPEPDGHIPHRLIANGSVESKYSYSVNSGIPDENAYVELSQLKHYCALFENSRYMCSEDLTKSFRQQHMHFDDIPLNGYRLLGLEMVDGRGPMGVRSSPSNMQELANMIVWVAINVVLTKDERAWTALFLLMLVYIDDYNCSHSTKSGCARLCAALHSVVSSLGLSFNPDKSLHLVQYGDTHGYFWDLPLQRFRLSDKRYNKLIKFLRYSQLYDYITIRAAFSLSGALMSYSNIIPEAKSCVYSLIYKIYSIFDSRKKQCRLQLNKILFIHPIIKHHLKMWLIFILNFKWCSIARILYKPSNVIVVASDACDYGFGFVSHDLNIIAMVQFSGVHRFLHINHKELYAALVFVYSATHLITGKHVKFLIDNTSVVCAISHRWSKSFMLMIMIFELCFLATKYKFSFYVDWIATKDNFFADTLSRLNYNAFVECCALFNIDINTFKQLTVNESFHFKFFN